MTSQRKKEIESLRAKLASLEAAHEKEEQEREAQKKIYQQLLSSLEEAGISFDSFVRCNYRDIRKVTVKIEREKEKEKGEKTAKSTVKRTKATVKKGRGRKIKATVTVKIPAGQYSNIPAEPEKVFTVKEKGPRPKALKAYAEEVGLEAFMNNCRIAGS
ncbi:MAG: hypothetical protein RPU64_09635 [Candidatus Sedimenticola sp. (ex Thyasira tokunagai)]